MVFSLLALPLLTAPPESFSLPAAGRCAEDERLRSLGLTVPESGVQRSTDGGKSWSQVLSRTGAGYMDVLVESGRVYATLTHASTESA